MYMYLVGVCNCMSTNLHLLVFQEILVVLANQIIGYLTDISH